MASNNSKRQILAIIALASMMLIAGCFSPPSPPNQSETETTPEPQPYTSDASEINFMNVHNDTVSALNNQTDGYHTQLQVTINDPRLDSPQNFSEQYRVNDRTEKRLYQSNFGGQQHAKYHDSVLYYEKTGEQVNAKPISQVDESQLISTSDAAGNGPLVQVGMNSIQYSLSEVQYVNGAQESRYTGSQSVSNYAVDELIPDTMDYDFGDPQTTSEKISSTVVMQKNGLMTAYEFKYSAKMLVDGSQKDFTITVRYQIVERSPNLPVQQPAWAENASA